MRFVLVLAVLTMGASASAQVDPLAPLPDAPPPVVQRAAQPAVVPASSSTLMGFAGYKVRLSGLARAAGVREATIQSVVPFLSLNSRVIELDRAQRPTSTSSAPSSFASYLSRHVTASLINRGYSRYAGHWTNLSRIRERYGVEPSVVIAIYGKETS